MFAGTYGWLVGCLVPEEAPTVLVLPFMALGAAFAIWLIGSMGPQSAEFTPILKYCGAGILVDFALSGGAYPAMWVTQLAGIWAFTKERQWRVRPSWVDREGFSCRRLALWWAAIAGLFLVCSVGFYQHAYVINEAGEKIRVKDTIQNLRNSPFWQEFDWEGRWEDFKSGKFSEGWEEMKKNVDLEGEAHAHEVLGLERGAEVKEIKRAHRKLILRHHPDKVPQEQRDDPDVQARFIEIQESYELLKKIHERREKKEQRQSGGGGGGGGGGSGRGGGGKRRRNDDEGEL